MRRGLRDLDGRVLAGAIVAVFFIALASIDATTGSAHWMKIGVDARATKFEDMRSLTSSWDCERRGIEAFPNNPCDPFGRPANYPRILTRLGVFGLGGGDTTALGVVTAIVFFLAALLVTGRLTFGEGLIYAAALLSPAVLLGVERGNVDLIMFALVALGIALLRRSPWAGAAPIALAGALKLFPTFGLAVMARKRSRWTAGAVWLALLAVYAAVTLNDIRALLRVLPRGPQNSYGALVIADRLHDSGVSWVSSAAEIRTVRIGVIIAGCLLAAAFLALRQGRGSAEVDERRLDAFWAGAAIYIGTYVLSANFDYRLVFLLLCVPQLCAWRRSGRAPAPWPAAVLIALLATLWLSSTNPPLLPFGLQSWYLGLSFPPEEALNWFLFAWLTAALISALPGTHRRRLAT